MDDDANADIVGMLGEYFSNVAPEQLLSDTLDGNPDIIADEGMGSEPLLANLGIPGNRTSDVSNAAFLHPLPTHPPLGAYATAQPIGGQAEHNQLMNRLLEALELACSDTNICMYRPQESTRSTASLNVQDRHRLHVDRDRLLGSDLLIYITRDASIDDSQEINLARSAMLPILVISNGSSCVSRMVMGTSGLVVTGTYNNPDELRTVARESLTDLRPHLVYRRMVHRSYDENIVGNRVRSIREALGLTREQVCLAASSPRNKLSVALLRRIEHSSDVEAGLSLVQLRELAYALKTTVADLVEPDLDGLVLSKLSMWVSDRQAVRFRALTGGDRSQILRRLLLRLVDSLVEDS